MATLVLSVVGTLVAGPIGGAIGALAGSAVDSAIGTYGNVQGPRLSDLSVTTSSYGAAIPRHFGTMRVPGTIIWASDLAEQSATSGGKGKPSITTYSYTSSFAVALASRPLIGVGRIWADGNLLRGAAGDLKVGGAMRFYCGDANQLPDPLIVAAEGADSCPAFRNLAYVVFEGLQLANFGNRIPTLSFEVFADAGALSLAQLFAGESGIDAEVTLDGITGFSGDGPFKDVLAAFQPVLPMDCNADGDALVIAPARLQTAPLALGPAATSAAKGDFGGNAGYTRARAPLPANPPRVLRYYDSALDYQPGSQRAPGQPGAGQPLTIQLPATMTAPDALRLISGSANRAGWARDTLLWRTCELDPAVAPGAVVTVAGSAGHAGQWRVNIWEWRDTGVELALERLAPLSAVTGVASDSGRANTAADLSKGVTALAAFELPWDGTRSADSRAIYAAVSSASPAWSGAALYADRGGALTQIGASGRGRSIMGTTVNALASAGSALFDRRSMLTVQLLGDDMALVGATPRQLAAGTNRAWVGGEIIQFSSVAALGAGRWRISNLLRGRGGTEGAIAEHSVGESFVLLDGAPVALDPAQVGSDPAVAIAAIGLGDSAPADSRIAGWGRTLRPLCPVHPQATATADGGWALAWTRRARGGWLWLDGVDAPLVEQAEAYEVLYGPTDAPVARWQVAEPGLILNGATMAGLTAAYPHGALSVRQSGTYALSDALLLTQL